LKKLTIITPVFNRAELIEAAINSVLNQNYSQVEHIILDGGSTDGTLDILRKYPGLHVISGPDQGMYDAINKGLHLATGDVIGLLNSDDYYSSNVFANIASLFEDDEVYAVAGQAEIIQEKAGKLVITTTLLPGEGEDLVRHSIFDTPIINAYFFSRKVFEEVGYFNLQYKIAADRDFMIRFALRHLKTMYINQLVYSYLQHSNSMTFSSTPSINKRIAEEHIQMAHTYLVSSEHYPPLFTKYIIELHTQETIKACAHSIRIMDLQKTIYYLKEGMQYTSKWLPRFIRYSIVHPIRQLLGFLYKSP
jgi:glycosyltransferase involved in cell wall biosynthesis